VNRKCKLGGTIKPEKLTCQLADGDQKQIGRREIRMGNRSNSVVVKLRRGKVVSDSLHKVKIRNI
jgi:hypothetical protein